MSQPYPTSTAADCRYVSYFNLLQHVIEIRVAQLWGQQVNGEGSINPVCDHGGSRGGGRISRTMGGGVKVKGKGLGTCYSAAYETRTAHWVHSIGGLPRYAPVGDVLACLQVVGCRLLWIARNIITEFPGNSCPKTHQYRQTRYSVLSGHARLVLIIQWLDSAKYSIID